MSQDEIKHITQHYQSLSMAGNSLALEANFERVAPSETL